MHRRHSVESVSNRCRDSVRKVESYASEELAEVMKIPKRRRSSSVMILLLAVDALVLLFMLVATWLAVPLGE